jgi:DNA polymerase-3 subunit epsilon
MDKYLGLGFSKSGQIGELFGFATPEIDGDGPDQFAVIDFETSGSNPNAGRIIEVAIVTVDSSGEVLEEFSTLVNPLDGQVGATFVHHIVPKMLDDAPTFDEVAEALVSRLSGKVVVAHNAAFEERFLAAELGRAKVQAPPLRALDTLQFFPRHFDLPNFKQSTVMQHLGIKTDEHTALGDTRGLAQILCHLLGDAQRLGYPIPRGELGDVISPNRVSQRVTNLRKGENGWMANLIAKLPVTSFAMGESYRYLYWDLLSEVLSDGKITGVEAKQIAILVGKSGLSQSDVRQLNREFFDQLKSIAEADGVVTDEERIFLDKVMVELAIALFDANKSPGE